MKRAFNRIAILVGLAFTAGCGPSTQNLCEANISNGLLNPETAEFFDFVQIDEGAFSEGWENMEWRDRGVSPEDRYKYGEVGEVFRDAAEETASTLKDASAEFYAVRLKADSRVGLKVTSNFVCAKVRKADTNTNVCECTHADER